MQIFSSVIIILGSIGWLPEFSILLLLLLPVVFLIRKGSGTPKITMHGIENIPTKGSVIFVASQVRFDEQFALLNLPVNKILVFDMSGLVGHPPQTTTLHKKIIYIQPLHGLRGIAKALKEGRAILKKNESMAVVTEWIKTEGGVEIDSFRLIKALLKKTNASVVPVHLEQPKGSNFAIRKNGVFNRNIINHETHWHLFAGKPFTSLEETKNLKAAIQYLSVQAAEVSLTSLPLVHIGFAFQALKDPQKLCFPDNTNPKLNLNYGKALVAASCLGNQLRNELKDETAVGV